MKLFLKLCVKIKDIRRKEDALKQFGYENIKIEEISMHLYPSLLFLKKLFVTEYIYIFFHSDSLSQVFEVSQIK